MYYKASYMGKCEVCGQYYYGILGLKCPKNDSSIILACFGLVLGGIVHGLVNNIVEAHIDAEWFFMGGAILGIIVGILLGRAIGKLGSKSDEEYASFLKKYNEDMERFNRVNKEIQGRAYKHEPDVNLEGGCFTQKELYAEYLS